MPKQHSYEKEGVFSVSVHLKPTSREIEHEAVNCYEKGSFYCVESPEGRVYKYPIRDIWRIAQPMTS